MKRFMRYFRADDDRPLGSKPSSMTAFAPVDNASVSSNDTIDAVLNIMRDNCPESCDNFGTISVTISASS